MMTTEYQWQSTQEAAPTPTPAPARADVDVRSAPGSLVRDPLAPESLPIDKAAGERSELADAAPPRAGSCPQIQVDNRALHEPIPEAGTVILRADEGQIAAARFGAFEADDAPPCDGQHTSDRAES